MGMAQGNRGILCDVTAQGIGDLLEAILLVADNADIRANPGGKVIGVIIEAELDKTRGVVATLLVQNGTLQTGDIVVAGTAFGRIKAMTDFRGKPFKKAGPSTPALVMGLSDMPSAGDLFEVVETDREAREIVTERAQAIKTKSQERKKVSLEDLFSSYEKGEAKSLNLVLKADVQGSLEPILGELEKLGQGEIVINVLYAETGNIGENDVMLASASKAIILGFNVQAEVAARRLAEGEGVDIRLYDIIYRLTEDIEKALKGMLAPQFIEKTLGRAQVLKVFPISKIGKIAGCRVLDGEIRRNGKIRMKRGADIVFEGDLSSLKHEKDDVREVRTGFECGVGLKNFHDIESGDIIECYVLEKSE